MPATANRNCGSRLRAAAIMSDELSMPLTAAPAKRAASSSVEFPGPHPRSMTDRARISGNADSKSRTGRVRSSSKATYCLADQLIVRAPTCFESRTCFQGRWYQAWRARRKTGVRLTAMDEPATDEPVAQSHDDRRRADTRHRRNHRWTESRRHVAGLDSHDRPCAGYDARRTVRKRNCSGARENPIIAHTHLGWVVATRRNSEVPPASVAVLQREITSDPRS